MSRCGFVEVEGGRLYYECEGDGPALLVTGGALDVRMWQPQVEALSQACTFIRADLRGYGQSSEPVGPYRHCDDLRTLLDALDFGRASVGGQSMGATVAIDFALAHPDAVTGLVLAPPLPVLGWEWVEGFPVKRALDLIATEGPDAAKAAFLDLPLHASAMANPKVAALLRRMYDDYSGWHYRHADPGRFEATDQIARLGEIMAPALVVIGGRDVLDARLTSERVAADIPNVEHRLIEHVGHYPNLEDPQLFNETVIDFLNTTT